VKDFFWWLFKDNSLVNYFYREIMFLFFPVKSCKVGCSSPLTNKDSVIKERLVCGRPPLFSMKGYTSGTTNKPLTVYRSIKSIFLEEYIIKSYMKKQGVPLKPKIAILRGDLVLAHDSLNPPYWRKMRFTGRLIFSSYHIAESTVADYFKALEDFKPDIIMAYPSSISLLAKYAKKISWKPNWHLVGVFTSSETFTLEKQELVRAIFGNVFDRYGQAERVATLQQCLYANYHVREDYSAVEFLKDDSGIRIVGSNFHNKAMPLVRYDTNDYVEGLNENGTCLCGNTSPYVVKIMGRDDDYVILRDGRHIGRLDVVFKGIDDLVECQLEQISLDILIVRYVAQNGTVTERLEKCLKESLEERLGIELKIVFESIKAVPRTRAGKFRSVIRRKDIVAM
jgi:Coenzyme F390 synthetase